MRLLVVEDEEDLAEALRLGLVRAGYAVDVAGDAAQAYERLAVNAYDLMLLDINLPDADGFGVCHAIRRGEVPVEGGTDLRVLMLTARGALHDRVRGLDEGADDYLVKPFALAELLARTRALLRRAGRAEAPTTTTSGPVPSGGLRVDVQARRVWVDDTEVALTSKEFDLLALLDSERGSVLTRETLMDKVWDENWFGSTKTLDVTMGRLRQKLDESGAPVQIVTVRGVGFRLESA